MEQLLAMCVYSRISSPTFKPTPIVCKSK